MMTKSSVMVKSFGIGLLLIFGLLFLCIVPVQKAFAASIPELPSEESSTAIPVSVKVALNQNDTRAKSLQIIKQYRTEAIDEGIVTLPTGMTRDQYINGIVWDSDLERIAVQRAIEAAVSFSHTRPDGQSCFTAQTSSTRSYGEIIATPGNVEYGMLLFYGEKEDYLKSLRGEPHGETGHYVALISPHNFSYGFGCVTVQGTASGRSGSFVGETGSMTASDVSIGYSGEYDATVRIPDSKATMKVVLGTDYIAPGASTTASLCAEFSYNRSNFVSGLSTNEASFASSNTAVATVNSAGVVKGLKTGQSTITASALGRSASTSLKVAELLDDATIAPIPDQTYTGSEITPLPKVTLGGKTLVKDRDYTVRCVTSGYVNNIDVRDNVTLIVEGIGNYAGSKTAEFKIVPAKITSAILSQTESVYDGSRKTPTVTVKAGSKTLAPYNYSTGKGDYYINAPNLTDAGEKIFTIEGRGNYTGTLEVKYTIKPASIASATVTLDQTKFIYDDSWHEPNVTVKMGNKTLDDWWDYSVSYPNDTWSVGTKTLTITGRGNYTGSLKATYEIVSASSPDTPSNPSTPNVPSNPTQPGTPSNPSTPANPDTPTQPSNPMPGTSDSEVATEVMFRLYNPNSGEHFYTSSAFERDHLIGVGWNDEGTGWIAPAEGGPVYRLYNPFAGEHHYTINAGERDMLVSVGWNDEGVGWRTGGSSPLYRLYNPNEFANNHHYSTSTAERDYLLSLGWQDEGIAWYGMG